jgi:hypothetical protein
MQSKNISVHSLEKGGENMNKVIYDKMKLSLMEFGVVDIADFSVHYLREFLGNNEQLQDLQQQVDNKAVLLSDLNTWE